MGAGREVLGQVGGGKHRRDGEATAQALGAGENVRHHAVIHISEQLASTAHAALYFIEHQQRVVCVAQLAGALQIGLLGRQYAALALHGFQHHGAGLVGNRGLQRLQVVVRHMGDALDLRPETVGVLRLAADADSEQSAAVEAVGSGDDLVLFRTEAVMGNATRQLERCLVGLGAGVAEEHALGEGRFDQLLAQAQGRLVGEHVGDVPQGIGLLGQRRDQCRVAVTQHVDGDAAGEVDQLSTTLIPDSRTQAAHGDEGSRGVVGDHELIEIGALHRIVLNGHQSSPDEKYRPQRGDEAPETTGDARIVGTESGSALSPCDNFLQRHPRFSAGFRPSDRKRRKGAV